MASALPSAGTELAILPVENALTEAHPSELEANESAKLSQAAEASQNPPENDDRSRRRHAAIMIALFATLFIVSLNFTLIGNATPTITSALNSAAGYAWIGGAFMLANAVCSPVWARLSDIWGRKLIVLVALAGFFASTVFCALSTSMTMLIAGRAFQGTFAGGLSQLVHIIISDLFSVRHRSLYMGLLEIIWAVAGGVGPVLGGALVQNVSWRWIFWIILPPCSLSAVLLFFSLDVYNPRTGLKSGLSAIDWTGSLAMLGFLVMLLLGLNLGGIELAWNSATVVCLIVFGALLSLIFVYCEKRIARYPLLPLGIFTSKSNLAVLIVAFAHDFALFSTEFYMPFYFQSVKMASPTLSGLLILPFTLGTALSGLAAGLYIHRTGRYAELFWLGQALPIAAFGLFTQFKPYTSVPQLCGVQLVSSAGMGMLFAPPLVVLQASLPQQQVATATATMTLVRGISVVLAAVSGQAIFSNGMRVRHSVLESAGLPEMFLEAFSGKEAAANVGLIAQVPDPSQRLIVRQQFAESLLGIWILNACLMGLGLLASPLVQRTELAKEHVETKTGLEHQDTGSRPAL